MSPAIASLFLGSLCVVACRAHDGGSPASGATTAPPVDVAGAPPVAASVIGAPNASGPLAGGPAPETTAPASGSPGPDAPSRISSPTATGGTDEGPSADESPASPAGTPWHLPWTAGETWYLTSGPHSGRRAALDFAPPNLNPKTGAPFANSCSRERGNQYWVRATAPGRVSSVLRDSCPIVAIDHDNGVTSNYFHLDRKSVRALNLKVGDHVAAGQILGHPSCEIGPKVCGATHAATGVHVHFFQTITGTRKRLPATGMVLSGWKVRARGSDREGVMVKGSERRTTRGPSVGRACAPEIGLCGGHRNDLESDNGRPPPMVSLADTDDGR